MSKLLRLKAQGDYRAYLPKQSIQFMHLRLTSAQPSSHSDSQVPAASRVSREKARVSYTASRSAGSGSGA